MISVLEDLKGMFLMKLMKLKKVMAPHLKFSHLFGDQQRNTILKKYLQKRNLLKSVKKK